MNGLLRSFSRTLRALAAKKAGVHHQCRPDPGFGIGINTAMLSVVYGVVLAPLPFDPGV